MHIKQQSQVRNKRLWFGGFGLIFLLTLLYSQVAWADVLAVSETFDNFDGSGFVTTPTVGQLDSDIWRVTGLSDGDSAFGADSSTGDFARGISTGGTTSGGVYAFDDSGNIFLGVQPTGSDFTPGTITMRMRNNTGGTITAVSVAYDIIYFNDQGRSNSLNFSYSTDDITYTPIGALDFTTPAAPDAQPAWASVNRSTTITSLSLVDGALFYIRWNGADAGGSGSRDEYGIDNITVSELDATAVALQDYGVNSSATNAYVFGSAALMLALLTIVTFKRKKTTNKNL